MHLNHDTPPIGREQIRSALDTLRRYKAGKANLERRIIKNEEFWKLRHWDHIPEQGTTGLKTKSAWLVNVLLSKHADAMDAYPEPACLPRAADDEAEARLLSKVIPVILAQNDFAKLGDADEILDQNEKRMVPRCIHTRNELEP